jgi:hypothetical protein
MDRPFIEHDRDAAGLRVGRIQAPQKLDDLFATHDGVV